LAGKIILPPSCMALVFFREPWYLRRNKHLFSYEVPEFRISESEFQFSDSPDIGIKKIFSDRNLWNQKRNWNSAYDGGPRNWNQKSEFPTKLLSRILFFLSIPSYWLDDVIMTSLALLIMTSLALLTDVVLASLESLAIVVGVAFIGLGGVKIVCSTVSLKLTNFLVLPNPTPYSKSELLSL
jgi:hypothetical protein